MDTIYGVDRSAGQRRRLAAWSTLPLAVLVATLTAGCSGGSGTAGPASDTRGGGTDAGTDAPVSSGSNDAATPSDDASDIVSSDAATAPDTNETIPTDAAAEASSPVSFLTNTPGVTFTNQSTNDVGDLVLLSSDLTEQNTSPGFYYQQFFGEVRNVSSKLYCFVNIQITISPGPGSPLSLLAYADTATPYQVSGLMTSVACIPPGGTGAFWSNNISSVSANLPSSTSFDYKMTGLVTSDVPNVATPTVVDQVVSTVLGYEVQGTLTPVASISDIEVNPYVRDAAGLIVDHLSAVTLGSYGAGESWSFQSTATSESIATHLDTLSFITAVAPAAAARLRIPTVGTDLVGLAREAAVFTHERESRRLTATAR
jgi:hypothetical protein